jgi:HD-GYP domain-containing protein (c-di-GMP phosphodiesterase class II)
VAIRELEANAGRQFDPACVALLLDCLGDAVAEAV